MRGYFDRLMEMSSPDQIHDSSLNHGKKDNATDMISASASLDFKGYGKNIFINENLKPVKPGVESQKEGVDVSIRLQKNKELNFNDNNNRQQGNQSRFKNNVMHSKNQTDLQQVNHSLDNKNRLATDNERNSPINVITTSSLPSFEPKIKNNDYDANKKDYPNERNKDTIEDTIHKNTSLINEQINKTHVKNDLISENIISANFLATEQNMSIDDSLGITDHEGKISGSSMIYTISTKNDKDIGNYPLNESANFSDTSTELNNPHSKNPDSYDNINVTIGSIILKINGDAENESYKNQKFIQSNSENNDNGSTGTLRRYYIRSRLR